MPDPLKKLLKEIGNAVETQVVYKHPGIVKDVYTDMRGNQLIDGPFNFDYAICKNHAKPSPKAIAQALRTLENAEPISYSSPAYAFSGPNPIAQLCEKAAKTR